MVLKGGTRELLQIWNRSFVCHAYILNINIIFQIHKVGENKNGNTYQAQGVALPYLLTVRYFHMFTKSVHCHRDDDSEGYDMYTLKQSPLLIFVICILI